MKSNLLFITLASLTLISHSSHATPFAQEAYVKPAAVGSTQSNEFFGFSVAISGDTAVVGAVYENSSSTGVNTTPNETGYQSGAAYVYVRTGGVWTQEAYLKPAAVGTSQVSEWFGRSVAISGDTIVIGAPGEHSSTTGINSSADESAGYAGAAYIYVRNAGVWTQQAYLKPAAVGTTQAGDFFGASVAISGNTVVVGALNESTSATGTVTAPNEAASQSGAVYVYLRTGNNVSGTWAQEACLKPTTVGSASLGDRFGRAVAIDGNRLAVSAQNEPSTSTGVNSTPNESGSGCGAVYVFERNNGVWTEEAYLKPASVGTTQNGDVFGGWEGSLSISGNTIAVGSYGEDSSTTGINSTPDEGANLAGAVYVFERNLGVWAQQAYLKPAAVGSTQSGDRFGMSVSISGNTLVVGADAEGSSTTGVNGTPDETASAAGAAYVFERSGNTWSQTAYLKPAAVGTSQSWDLFGAAVAVSGDTVVVGAYLEDSSNTTILEGPAMLLNSNYNESAGNAGAAYIFRKSDPQIAVTSDPGGGIPSTSVPNAGTFVLPNTGICPGSESVATLTITNNGTSPLTGLVIPPPSGTNAADFTVTQPLITSLFPGDSTTFTVAFHPSTTGPRSSDITIGSNDAPYVINLQGIGVLCEPDISVDDGNGLMGNVAAWGDNEFKQCDLPKGIMAKAIAGSHGHSLIVRTNGTVVEVGRLQGLIAYPGSGDTYTPMPAGLSNVVAVSSEYGRNVALDNFGHITVWGVDAIAPTFPPNTVIKAIASGRYHSVALDTAGNVYAWSSGFPGRGDTGTELIPYIFPEPQPTWVTTPNSWTGVAAISAISGHTVALKTNGSILCAGYDNQGETSVPGAYVAANPLIASVVPGSYETSIAAGVSKTVVRKANGDFDTWGLGDAWDTNSPFVPPPPAATDIIAVAAGIEHYLALHSDGTVDAWGYNSWKQTTNTGTGGSQGGSYAYLSHPLADVKAIACGEKHNLALTNSAHSYFRLISPTTTSTAKTYTIRNPGHASLTVTSVAIVGPSNGFSVSTTGMAASIPAGGSTKFKITFTQPASGPHDAKLRITTNDPDLPQFDITLYGTAPGFPIIKTQPVGKTVTAGSPVTFSVAAVGTGLTYDWQKGGVSLGAPNSPTFTIPSAAVSSRGSYSVVVSNSIGTLVSNFVPLIVNAPIVITAPVSPDIRYIGDSTTFSVSNTGTNVAYQWYKGSTAISGATGPGLTLSNLKATDAAIYKVKLSNTLTTLYSSASLVVVDPGSYAQDVADGSNALLTARAYGTPTSHAWSFSAAPASNPAKYLNPSGHVLTVKTAVDPTDEGPYTCVITNGSAGSLTTGAINLRVLIKPVVNPLVLPTSIMVSEPVKIPVSATNNPTSFAISGLPKGLTYDKTTGLISGHALVKGSFTIKVTATNLDGTSPVVQGTLTVTALVGSATGTYEGPVQRHPVLGSNLGGRIRITVSSAGVISGTLYLGKATHSLVGALNITPTGVPVLSDIFIDRKAPDNDLHLTYLIDTATRSLTGTLENGHLAGTSFLPDFSNTPFTGALITNTPALYGGNYTLAASHSVGGDDKPQGYSYASFKVSTGAIVSGAFKLADSTSITFSGSVDQSGSFPVFNLLYTNTGSFQGQVNIDTAQNNRLNASALTWNKNPQTGSTRYFKSGFGPLILSTIGRKYTSPASGALALGLTPGAGNAKLVFTDGLAPSPTTRWNVPALEIKAISPLITLPANVIATPTVGSHVQLSTLSIVPGIGTSFTVGTTALVKGKFSLKDLNPVNTAQTITRTNTFEALIVDDGTNQKACGYFLLEELPAITGDTPTNTKYHSGKVVLSATP